MKKLSFLDWASLLALVIGAINWGLVGLFKFNLVDSTFGRFAWKTRIIYILIGMAGVYLASNIMKLGRVEDAPLEAEKEQ